MVLRGLCLLLGLACADSELPPATAHVAGIKWPRIVELPIVAPSLSKPPLSKPTGFPPDCIRQPPVEWQAIYVEAARRYPGVTACDLAKLTWCESRFDTRAVSPVGAKGLAQLMDPTAADLGVTDSFDPRQSVPAAARYVLWTRSGWSSDGRTGRDVKGLGLGSWNWGHGNMVRDQRRNGWYSLDEALPHFPAETQGFVPCGLTGERE